MSPTEVSKLSRRRTLQATGLLARGGAAAACSMAAATVTR